MRKLVRYPIYILIFIAVCSAAGYITFRVMGAGLTVTVPNVSSMSIKDAESAIENIGLSMLVKSEKYDPNVPLGHIIEQDIEPGSHIRGHAEVKVVASKGPEVRLIPSVLDESLENAKNIFMQKGIVVSKIINVHSESLEKGKVIAQRPAPEEWTGEGITLVVSAGPYDTIYYCPSFQGMLKEDALLLAAELGLNVKLKESSDADAGLKIVIKQQPPPGSEKKMGETVYLTIGGSDD
jgi:serine/threonine-protein kinase